MPPSRDHEVPLVLLSENAVAARTLVRAVTPIDDAATLEPADPTTSIELVRTRLPDRVWILRDAFRTVREVFMLELEREWSEEKRLSWCASAGALQGQHACPVRLVLVTGTPNVVRRARRGVRYGDLSLVPRVLTTAQLANLALRTEDPSAASALAITALRVDQGILTARHIRALVADHRERPPPASLRPAFADALRACAGRFHPATFKTTLESLMLDLSMFEDGSVMASREGKELLRQFAEKVRREGEKRGEKRGEKLGEKLGEARAALARLETKREDVLEVIELRLGAVPESAREAVTGCTRFEALKAAHRALVLGESLEAVVATLR